jgi:hypothetical protein
VAESGWNALFGGIIKDIICLTSQASDRVVLTGSTTFLAFHDIN